MRVMRRLVASYVHIVAKTTRDLVPKVAMKSVVLHVERSLHGHLISNLLKCALSLTRETYWRVCASCLVLLRWAVHALRTGLRASRSCGDLHVSPAGSRFNTVCGCCYQCRSGEPLLRHFGGTCAGADCACHATPQQAAHAGTMCGS